MKYVPPSIRDKAFNCPHCGALAQQFWFSAFAEPIRDGKAPRLFDKKEAEELDLSGVEDLAEKQRLLALVKKMADGEPFLQKLTSAARNDYEVHNVHLSRCYHCHKPAIWLYDRLIWPVLGSAPEPNADLPADVRRDYVEAGVILDLSPRGAAALLRCGLETLLIQLGGKGRNLDDNIGALVARGLDRRIQQALDVVRVVGNNAVHPGQIDIRDDRATAEELFRLVNLIADAMITQPKHIDEMYDRLPEGAKEAIQKRDDKPAGKQ